MRTIFYTGFLLVGLATLLPAQSEKEHASRADSLRDQLKQEEFILEEILIEGVVEKPNVTILPSRKETEFGQVDFINRSFAPELQAVPRRGSFLNEDWKFPIMTQRLREILSQNKKSFIKTY